MGDNSVFTSTIVNGPLEAFHYAAVLKQHNLAALNGRHKISTRPSLFRYHPCGTVFSGLDDRFQKSKTSVISVYEASGCDCGDSRLVRIECLRPARRWPRRLLRTAWRFLKPQRTWFSRRIRRSFFGPNRRPAAQRRKPVSLYQPRLRIRRLRGTSTLRRPHAPADAISFYI